MSHDTQNRPILEDIILDSGNICRSPIAEAVFLDEVKKRGLEVRRRK